MPKRSTVDEQKMIPICDGYSMAVDKHNYSLLKNVVGKSKRTKERCEYTSVVGYYPSIEMLLHGLMDNMDRNNFENDELKTLSNYVENQRAIKDYIHTAVGNIKTVFEKQLPSNTDVQ